MPTSQIPNSMLDEAVEEESDYEVAFNFARFLRIFIYHLLFFISGVFATALIILIQGYGYTRNMVFIGCKPMMFIQHSVHFAFVAIFILFVIFEPIGFTIHDLLFPILSMLTRSCIIGIRYGYMSESRHTAMKKVQTSKWISEDLIVTNWDRIPLRTSEIEITVAMNRLNIEPDNFNFTFLQPLAKSMHEKLQNEDSYAVKEPSM